MIDEPMLVPVGAYRHSAPLNENRNGGELQMALASETGTISKRQF